jgi:hypothetical protein
LHVFDQRKENQNDEHGLVAEAYDALVRSAPIVLDKGDEIHGLFALADNSDPGRFGSKERFCYLWLMKDGSNCGIAEECGNENFKHMQD